MPVTAVVGGGCARGLAVFSIGPAYEGDNIDDRTYALIQKGRKVHICVSQPQDDPRGFHPENYIGNIDFGYTYDPHMRW